MTNLQPDDAIDVEALTARYASERDRRVRSDGEDQYVKVADDFGHYDDDPFARGTISREPRSEETEVLIVGAGFGALMASVELMKRGIRDIRIVDIAADFGGTWYWNRYPGAQCDIESYIYLPLLEETGYIPKEKYAYQPEIHAHVQRIVDHFGLRELAVLRTRITEMRWDDAIRRWRVSTDRGDDFRPRFVINSTGPANRPKLPGIPGLERFAGKTFHTARWDYDYTGGDTTGGLTRLADKRVAVIGTGASAIQVVPHVGASAKQLYVFQRTPSSVDLRANFPTDPQWAASLKPGWQRQRRDNFDALTSGERAEVDLVNDCWTHMLKDTPRFGPGEPIDPAVVLETQNRDMRRMMGLHARIDEIVHDRDTAEALKPWYPQYCKRPTFNDDYLPTFNQPNVKLVDTSGSRGVEAITSKGIVVGGAEYDVDCIIFATGFEITTSLERRWPISIVGQRGVTLTERWKSELSSFHGYTLHGFPNWFFMGGGQSGVSPNYSSLLAGRAEHLAYVISEAGRRGALTVQPTPEAEAEWVGVIRQTSAMTVMAYAACTPGVFNNEGKIAERAGGGLGEIYAAGLSAFHRLLREWRYEGSMRGLELETANVNTPRMAETV